MKGADRQVATHHTHDTSMSQVLDTLHQGSSAKWKLPRHTLHQTPSAKCRLDQRAQIPRNILTRGELVSEHNGPPLTSSLGNQSRTLPY